MAASFEKAHRSADGMFDVGEMKMIEVGEKRTVQMSIVLPAWNFVM